MACIGSEGGSISQQLDVILISIGLDDADISINVTESLKVFHKIGTHP